MNKKGLIRTRINILRNICLIYFLFNAVSVVQSQEYTKPNIILILADDLGLGDIGCYFGRYKTPNIDKIAEQGRRFTQYYSASPICSPSRVGILAGQIPAKLHFTTFLNTREDNRRKEQVDYLDPSVPTVAKLLKAGGYATAHFGKWHMGGGRDVQNAPNFDRYGFDEWASTYESPDPDPALTATNWIWSDQDSVKRWNRTAYLVDKTLSFLKRHNGQPCYINLWTDDVHTPWIVSDEYVGHRMEKPQSERNFEVVLAEFDRQLGRLLAGLVEMGVDQNTVLIFTSDNGPLPNFRQDRSAGLRGSKLSLYEGGIRMPFIIRWPEKIRKNSVDSLSVVSALDLLPTLVALAGVEVQGNMEIFDGEDRSAVWLGKPSSRKKPLYWEYGRNSTYFNTPKPPNRSPALAYRKGNWKFLMNIDGSQQELYDLECDPKEQHNLSMKHPKKIRRFRDRLMDWWADLPPFDEDIANRLDPDPDS
ncbi:sulfatase-like hydrolase/transferase [Sphingobacterium suaedae]|uniref:Sulfatase-like hydrolase/transferase n=1 Tax=Sphingobacterium suaedae TaxID=1686402 RepID=A0ABW5KFS1_9SPHI